MNHLNLPEPVAAYFEADSQDAEAVARCFTDDARVVDEGRTHQGRAAIRAWKTAASRQFSYRVEPFAQEKRDRAIVVTSRVIGDFPGSPVDLRYEFTLQRGLIATLEIAP